MKSELAQAQFARLTLMIGAAANAADRLSTRFISTFMEMAGLRTLCQDTDEIEPVKPKPTRP